MSHVHPELKELELKEMDKNKKLYLNQSETGLSSWFDFSNLSYFKGFTIAAGITAIAASPKLRESIIKGGVKTWQYFQGGIEELKEKVQDVKAEMAENADEKNT